MAWMASERTASARATIACYYLPTQGAYLCKLCLYLFSHFLGFLLGVCKLEVILEVGILSAQEFLLSCWNHQPEQ